MGFSKDGQDPSFNVIQRQEQLQALRFYIGGEVYI